MSLDVKPHHLVLIQDILRQHLPDYAVFAFGSRTQGKAKEFSDLDLCIQGSEPLSFQRLGQVRDAFSESNLPYKIDVIDWATTSTAFRELIEQDKIMIQSKNKGHSIAE